MVTPGYIPFSKAGEPEIELLLTRLGESNPTSTF